MPRFIIRNYGQPRQIPHEGKILTVLYDGVIETDDPTLALVADGMEKMHVSDRGEEFISPSAREEAPEVLESTSEVFESAPDASIEPEAAVADSEELSYEDLTVAELKALCKDREINSTKLRKAELIEALQAYDEEPDKPVEDAIDLTDEAVEIEDAELQD